MPPHPDRVRRSYEDKIVIALKDLPVHVCDKVYTKDIPYLLPSDIKTCPSCGENLNRL